MSDYIYIIAPLTGAMIAQLFKIIFDLRKDGLQLKDLVESGGMPSAHSTAIVSLTVVIGQEQGYESAIFGLTLVVSGLVIYDAINVRRLAGENTIAINHLAKRLKLSARMHHLMAKGHTPGEVIFGALLGIANGLFLTSIL